MLSLLRNSAVKRRRELTHKSCRLAFEQLEDRRLMAVDLKSYSFGTTPTSTVPGQTVHADVWVGNFGATPTPAFVPIEVEFYLSRPDSSGSPLYFGLGSFALNTFSLGANSSAYLGVNLTLPAASDFYWSNWGNDFGIYTILAWVDPFNRIAETNESNNLLSNYLGDYSYVSIDARQPDLTTLGITVIGGPTFQPGDAIPSMIAQIVNQGSVATGSFKIGFYLSIDSVITSSDRLFSDFSEFTFGLAGNSSENYGMYGFSLPAVSDPFWGNFSSSTYYIGVIADTTNAVIESNEFNNSNRGFGYDVVQITVLPPPELAVLGTLTVTGNTPYRPGDAATVSVTVDNSSPTSASAFEVAVYLSTDSTIDGSDRLLGTFPIASLSSLGTTSLNQGITLPDADDSYWGDSATYYIGVVVDPFGEVAEQNESNNSNRGVGIDIAPIAVDLRIDVNELPATGDPRGAIMKAFLTHLKAGIKNDVKQFAAMRKQYKNLVPLPTVDKDLKALLSSVTSIGNKLSKVINGRAFSVTLAPGVIFTQVDLDLFERTVVYAVNYGSTDIASNSLTAKSVTATTARTAALSPIVASAAKADNVGQIAEFFGYGKEYRDVRKRIDNIGKSYDRIVDSIASAPSKAYKYVTGLFGVSAVAEKKAESVNKAISEGGPELQQRVDEMQEYVPSAEDEAAFLDSLLTGAPLPFRLAGDRLKAVERKVGQAVQAIQLDIIDLEADARNQSLPGFFRGTVTRTTDNLSGELTIYFSISSTKKHNGEITGTIKHAFFNGTRRESTSGTFKGALDENYVFRGTTTIRNSSGRGTFNIAWQFDDRDRLLNGTLYQGQPLTFATNKN